MKITNFLQGKVDEQSSQAKTVLAHLQKYGRITSMEAISKYRITRLAAVIYDLRDEYVIDSDERAVSKRGKQYAIYKWVN